MFPGAGALVYYNDAGEPLGWDYPSYDPEYDPDDYLADDYDDDRDDHHCTTEEIRLSTCQSGCKVVQCSVCSATWTEHRRVYGCTDEGAL